MHILLSNDDGYQSPGLRHLISALGEMADISVVAPDQDRSGASNSLTLVNPLRVRRQDDGVIAVNGTPTDCVHLGLTGLLDSKPDIVVSGINHGANLGDDVLYSGTVAAAMEGRFLGLPAIAVSCVSYKPQHLQTAAKAVQQLLPHVVNAPLDKQVLLNVNVPDLPWQEIKGFASTRLGYRHPAEAVVSELDPRGHDIYWIGPAGEEADAGEGTDFHAVRAGYVSVTPIQVDLTRHASVAAVAKWLDNDVNA